MSTLNQAEIEALLPHRAPFLMLDRVTELAPGTRGVGEKDITEAMCAGHFPGHPIMPGVLITEAMAQLAAVVALSATPELRGRPVYLLGVDKLRLRRPVLPGDTLEIEATFVSERRRLITFSAEARVGGKRCANATLLATAPEAPAR